MDSPEFSIWQSQLPNRLGVSIDAIREKKRALAEGADYVRDGNRVLFCLEGVRRLMTLLAEKDGGGGFPARVLMLPAPREIELTVTKVCANFHILECSFSGVLETFRVRVQNNRNFVPRMTIKARVEGSYYILVGRIPRFRGKY